MEKTTLSEIKSDIKYKRDSLHLAHEDLKQQSDYYNKFIIFISLASTLFETAKMKMGWNDPSLELFPIVLSSIVAAISALIKFKRYNEQQEVLVQSCTVLTSTLSKARNSTEVDEALLREYHEALELLETSLYPDVRKRFLKASQKNLVSIIANEDTYFSLIEKAKNGQDISAYRSDDNSSHHSEENIQRYQRDIERGASEMRHISEENTLTQGAFESKNEESPISEKQLEQVQEEAKEDKDTNEVNATPQPQTEPQPQSELQPQTEPQEGESKTVETANV
jgi:HD superfamily phosphohydrolase